MKNKKTKFETFNDGIVYVYKTTDISLPGYKPCLKPLFYRAYNFAYRTIGVKRNYEAMQLSVRLDELISIHLDRNISPQDVIVIEGVQYDIKQIQHRQETKPPTSLLSLQRREEFYDDLDIR